MASTRRVALLIETSREYGRGLLRGIRRFQQTGASWSIYFQPRGTNDPAPTWLASWRGDGILARIENRAMAKAVKKTGIPAVDLRFGVPNLKMPGVGVDNRTVVELAIRHFQVRGFRRVAFCGYPIGESIWMDLRRKLFQELAAETGMPCVLFSPEKAAGKERTWDQDQKQLVRWLRQLEKPVAIMACNDTRGLEILDACRRDSIAVPSEVTVLGVDNDEFLCGLSTPPMSSVDVNQERIGYRAAELLQALMDGAAPPSEPILFPAERVVARRSTDSFAVEDAELAAALRYLREHACQGVRMSDIVKATGMQRRTLERRMKAALGRTPKEELLRIQMEDAKRMLTQTDLPIKRIAGLAGFASSRYFGRVFLARIGMTPGQYRKNAKTGR